MEVKKEKSWICLVTVRWLLNRYFDCETYRTERL